MYLAIFIICSTLFLNLTPHVMQWPLAWATPPETQIRVEGLFQSTPAPNTAAGVLSRQEKSEYDFYMMPSEVGSFGRKFNGCITTSSKFTGFNYPEI